MLFCEVASVADDSNATPRNRCRNPTTGSPLPTSGPSLAAHRFRPAGRGGRPGAARPGTDDPRHTRQVLGVVLAILAILTSGMGLAALAAGGSRYVPARYCPVTPLARLPRVGSAWSGSRARIGGSQARPVNRGRSTAASDRGLQAELTTLAWDPPFALLVNGVLLLTPQGRRRAGC